ncbi:MAG: hypothetical protein GY820_12550 [Gammaproteobacteria bacterium]|nr:hypothetical protein [Gammaproteobacteria bacterium]
MTEIMLQNLPVEAAVIKLCCTWKTHYPGSGKIPVIFPFSPRNDII